MILGNAMFLTPLELRREPGRDDGKWTVDAQFEYYSKILEKVIIIPKGFETDLASVPRLPIAYMLFGGVADEAAVVHDWLYTEQSYPRSVCDAVLREAMAASGVNGWRRWGMWAGVRVGGWVPWNARKDGKPWDL